MVINSNSIATICNKTETPLNPGLVYTPNGIYLPSCTYLPAYLPTYLPTYLPRCNDMKYLRYLPTSVTQTQNEKKGNPPSHLIPTQPQAA